MDNRNVAPGADCSTAAPESPRPGKLRVPPEMFRRFVLLNATPLKSVVVPAPDLLKVPLLLNAWAAPKYSLKSPSAVTLKTPPGRLLMMPGPSAP